jgi:tRNA(Ile)-lysidine synthase
MLVAVSGGVDSMVLLHLLHALAPGHGWRLTVAHLNHRLRGRSSDADERLVRQTAIQLGLPWVGRRADVRKFASAHKVSVEMAARKIRHDFLARTARRLGIHTVALAHHLDDQVELFFLRLFRGSGGQGLAGMKWRNASPADSRIELVRPLLDQAKADLTKYAANGGIRFREDVSNSDVNIQRNRIRRELLPLLRRHYQPALDRTVSRAMDIAGAEAESISGIAAEWLGRRRRAPFGALPVAVQRRCVQLQLLRQKLTPDYDLVERLRSSPGTAVSISRGIAAILTAGGELLIKRAREVQARPSRMELEFQKRAGETLFGHLRIRWAFDSRRPCSVPPPVAGREYFDADKVGPKVVLRHWQPGDRFQPIGMSTPVKLQDLFTNRKIPREQRHDLVVLTTAGGELVWVERLRISERFKLSSRTNRRLQWRWKPL